MDKTREFHQRQVERGEISSDEPKRMVRVSGIPMYLDKLWHAQSERSLTSKQEIINYSISSGLSVVEDRRKGMVDKISRAQISLWEQATDLQMVWKIFSGNDVPLSDGPGQDRMRFLGFRKKVSFRLAEGLIEKTDHYHHALGIPKSRLYCIFSMVYLCTVPRIPDHYKLPMREDIATFVGVVDKLHERVKELVETEKNSPRPSYDLGGVDDIL